jgi:hypothetical protein
MNFRLGKTRIEIMPESFTLFSVTQHAIQEKKEEEVDDSYMEDSYPNNEVPPVEYFPNSEVPSIEYIPDNDEPSDAEVALPIDQAAKKILLFLQNGEGGSFLNERKENKNTFQFFKQRLDEAIGRFALDKR